ncbi:hypothetical protein FJ641_10510 [Clostridium perfringens]|nr:hypothetical protein [Clostridium perfringens]
MVRRKTHEEFIQDVKGKYGDEYTVLGKYINSYTKILVRHNCNSCNNYEWEITPNKLLQGKGCPICGLERSKIKQRKTHKEFITEIYNKYGNEYIILGEYVNSKTKLLIRHKCGYEYKTTPCGLLYGKGCPKCAGNIKKTTEEFKKEIYKMYGNEYEILEEYKGAHTKILVRHNCDKCNYHEYKVTPSNLLRGHSCLVCSNQKTVLDINTIWDTDRWMCDLGVSEEDAKRYSRCSNKKITVKCPDCGKKKQIKLQDIYRYQSICCSCGDGKSYPEKFVVNLLEQLNVDFEIEYSPKWIKPKRYDFYIPKLNMIIETHGIQHYIENFQYEGNRNLKEEKANDKYKKEIALANGIKRYIELDCRESNLEWIKNSILNSELNDLFDLSNIDWNKCAKFANKNIVKKVCEYWDNKREDEVVNDLMKKFNLSKNATQSYLKKGTKLGWCNYDPKEEKTKGIKKASIKLAQLCSKKVEIFKNNKSLGIFPSCNELERKSEGLFGVKLLNSAISRVCTGKKSQYKGFTFKYVEEDNNLNI